MTLRPFRLGTLFGSAFALLAANWRICLSLYLVVCIIPSMLLGEAADAPGDWLYPAVQFSPLLAMLLTTAFLVAQGAFTGLCTARLLRTVESVPASAVRCCVAAIAAVLASFGLHYVLNLSADASSWFEQNFQWLQLASNGLTFAASCLFLLWVPCAGIMPVRQWLREPLRLSRGVRWKLALVALLLWLAGGLASVLEGYFLSAFTLPDGTVLDWVTTFIQEILSTCALPLGVAVTLSAYQLLKRRQDGAPRAETAAVFD